MRSVPVGCVERSTAREAPAVGPAVGGFLFARNHLDWMFMGDALTTLVAITLIGLFIKEKFIPETTEEKNTDIQNNRKLSIFQFLLTRRILLFFPLTMALVSFMYSQWQFFDSGTYEPCLRS